MIIEPPSADKIVKKDHTKLSTPIGLGSPLTIDIGPMPPKYRIFPARGILRFK